MKFLIHSEFAELLDLAMRLKDDGHDVLMHVPSKEHDKIGEGIIDKVSDWYSKIGDGYVWVFDGCSHGKLQDWLRSRGEVVFGGSEAGDKLENDRQLGQKLFKASGFTQPESKNFKGTSGIDEALAFVMSNRDRRWILKQNGDAPKGLNHMGKFEGNEDMLFHLDGLKKKWNEPSMGPVDFDLMEVVEGLEVAASAYFNGTSFVKGKDGKVVGWLNFEEKKECDASLGETTGEMGTTFIGVTEDNGMFREMIMHPKITEALAAAKFRGIFDVNCIKTKEGTVALEATCRFGIPSTSYEMCVSTENVGQVLSDVASGKDEPISISMGVGMVTCVVAKPYPAEADMESDATSIGEKLWPLKSGRPSKDFSREQREFIHLQNFHKDGDYLVSTKCGYLLTVTSSGSSIAGARAQAIDRIKDNLYIAGMKYRTDIGKRVEDHLGINEKRREARDADVSQIKAAIKKIIYEE